MNPKCQFCDSELVDRHWPGYGVTGWECPNCGATYLEDRASMEIMSGPTDEWKMGEVQ